MKRRNKGKGSRVMCMTEIISQWIMEELSTRSWKEERTMGRY